MPDLIHTLLANDFDGGNKTIYGTASQTPPPNQLVLGLVCTHDVSNDPTAICTIAGNGLTWGQLATVQLSGSGDDGRLQLFGAMGDSPSAGAVTITYDQGTNGCLWIFGAVRPLNTSGVNGAGAYVAGNVKTTFSATQSNPQLVTLDAFSAPDNRPWAGFFSMGRNGTLNVGGGLTKLRQVSATGTQAIATEWKPEGQDTTLDMTQSAGADAWTAVALELIPAILPVPVARRHNPLLRM